MHVRFRASVGAIIQKVMSVDFRLRGNDRGRTILDDLGIDRFVVVSDDIYESIEELKTEPGW